MILQLSGLGSCATLDLTVLQASAVEMSFVSLHARSVASWSVALTSLITMFVSARPEFQGAQSAQAQVQGAA